MLAIDFMSMFQLYLIKMKLPIINYNVEKIEQALNQAGSLNKASKLLGCSCQAISQWLKRHKYQVIHHFSIKLKKDLK